MVKKIKYFENSGIAKSYYNSILLIGNFDGLHIGHQKLFKKAKIFQKNKKIKIGVLTFDPIPKMFFFKNIKNYRICNLRQKLNLFQKFNVDFVINKNSYQIFY